MGLLATLLERLRARRRAWWQAFEVSFDRECVVVRHTRKRVTEERFQWSNVRRVCFKDRGLSSDVFFVFTSERPEPFMVPVEANGGDAFWRALRQRGLFPDAVSAAAVQSTDGGYHCWPEQEISDDQPWPDRRKPVRR